MSEFRLEDLKKGHSSAKKKMILGIVFVGVALFLMYIAIMILSAGVQEVAVLFVLALPFLGVGIPFMILGIVKKGKYNRLISQAKQQGVTAQAAPARPQPVAQPAPQPEQPQVYIRPQMTPREQVQAQPAPDARVLQQEQEAFLQEHAYKPMTTVLEDEAQTPENDLDWQQYHPLEAGVSYDKGRDYKFHRADGFVGSVPQKFVDRTFPRCPICCTNVPDWTIAQHNQMSWKGNLYLFKCSHCQSIISMSMPDVTTLSNGAGGIASNPNVGLTNLMVKASSGKKAGTVYAVVESVGDSGVSRECEGKEFELEHLQQMFLRK